MDQQQASARQAVDTFESAIPVLLVEDNEIDVEITRRLLTSIGVPIRLYIARDGEEALSLLLEPKTADIAAQQAALPKLILLDLRLPTMDGLDLLRRIKRDSNLCPIPVAMLTGVTGDRPMLQCMEAGANMYFTKPMTAGDIIGVVETVQKYWVVMEGLRRRTG